MPVTLLSIVAIATIISILVLLSLLWSLSSNEKKGTADKVKGVPLPGPRPWPILGSSSLIGKYKNAWEGFSALRKIFGDIYGIKLGSRYCMVVSSASIMRQILVNRAHEFANRPDFSRFHAIFRGNRNLSVALCDWTPKHRTRRDTAYPPLHPRYSSLTGHHLSEIAENELGLMVCDLKQQIGKNIDPKPFMLSATANIFYRYICGQRFDREDVRFQEVVRIYDEVFRELFQGFAMDFMPWLKVVSQSKLNGLRQKAEIVGRFTEEIFNDHQTTLNPERPRDIVDQLLVHLSQLEKDETTLTREDAEVIIDDLIGGHSVLTNLWLWTMYLLALHPEAREKIRQEADKVFENKRRNPSLSDRSEMPYTEATIFESLRIVASPIIPHVAVADTTVEGYHVPKDTMVMFNTFDLNLDPVLWDSPLEFKPERFLIEGKLSKPNFFFPFGLGKRACMGDGLVKSILLLGLPTILRAMDFELAPGSPILGPKEIAGTVIRQEPFKLLFKPWSKDNASKYTTVQLARSTL